MSITVIAVVVTYQPDLADLESLLEALVPQVERTIVVDNGSRSDIRAGLDSLAGRLGAQVIPLETNVGIGAAQNVGIRRARELGAAAVLLSDQDSVPAKDMVRRLVEGLEHAGAKGARVGAVGPVTVDERAPGATLLFEARRWGPRRASLSEAGELVSVVFLLASGCLVPVEALDQVGEMNEPWFIDHVDLEWGLRARRAGLALFGVTSARLGHHLGDRTVTLPGRSRQIHIHSPIRNYYMARNTVLLIRSGLLPPAWRIGYAAWIAKYAVFYVLAVRPRGKRLRLLARGLADGARGRTGPLGRQSRQSGAPQDRTGSARSDSRQAPPD